MSSPRNTVGRARPMIVVAGAAALALSGVALLGVQGDAAAEETGMSGPMADGPRHLRAQQHAHVDQQDRAAHLVDLAERIGVDPEAFSEAMAELRAGSDAERDAMREQMAELDADERRDAMVAFAESRRAMMADALAELGVDPDVLAEHRAGHDRPDRERGPQMRGQHRMAGPHGQV